MTFLGKCRYIWNLWRPHRVNILFLALFTLVSSAVAAGYPLVLKVVIDGVERRVRAGEGLEAGAGGLFLVLVLIGLGRFIASFYPAYRGWMNHRIENDIRSAAFDEILKKDYRFPRAFRTGDVVTRLTDDISEYTKIAWFSCSGVFRAVDSGAKILFSLAAMLALEPRLALLSIAPLPVVLVAFYFVGRRLRDRYERQQEAVSRTNETLEAAFSGNKIVKAYGAEEGQSRNFARILDARLPVQLSVAILQAAFQAVDVLATRAGQVVALALGGLLVARGELQLGTLYAFYVYLDMIVHPLQDLPTALVSARMAFISVGRIEEMTKFPAGAARPPAAPAPLTDPTAPALELRAVRFRYDGADRDALGPIDLAVRRGERVAIAGEGGSGKSTLLKVLAGLLPPEDGGGVHAGGEPLASPAGWRALRARTGFVPQEATLFSETIRANVALGGPHVDPALETAQLAPDLARLERGAETVLGARGSLISGGQRQRVAVARALARRPEILLLDDATASFDAASEDRFWTALDAGHADLTAVVASHRAATLRRADRVVFLSRGRVVDQGPHEDLLARCEAYREAFDRAPRETVGAA